MSVAELEKAVTTLSKDELDRFNSWYEEYVAEKWDRQIEADIASGKLDAAGARADADFEAGRCTRL
jgi:hypothetical protein